MTDENQKELANLKAQFALKGHVVSVARRAEDGRTTYLVTRWGHCRTFSHTHDLKAFLAQIGGAA